MPGWTARHDAQLLHAVHKHGIEQAPAASLALSASPVAELVHGQIDAESGVYVCVRVCVFACSLSRPPAALLPTGPCGRRA